MATSPALDPQRRQAGRTRGAGPPAGARPAGRTGTCGPAAGRGTPLRPGRGAAQLPPQTLRARPPQTVQTPEPGPGQTPARRARSHARRLKVRGGPSARGNRPFGRHLGGERPKPRLPVPATGAAPSASTGRGSISEAPAGRGGPPEALRNLTGPRPCSGPNWLWGPGSVTSLL